MDVADEHRSFRAKHDEPRVCRRKQRLRDTRIGHLVHADIDDGGAGLDEVCRHEPGPPHRGDQNVRLTADVSQVRRP